MTREAAHKANQEAREWAARFRDVAVSAVLAHPATVQYWRPGTSAGAVAQHARPGHPHPLIVAGVPAPNVARVWHAADSLIVWADGLGRVGDGLSVLAAAQASMRDAEARQARQLPRFHRVSDADARMLPGFELGPPPVRDAILPGFEGIASSVPSWLLSVYDQAGGITEARGRGAPWGLRLFVGALLSMPVEFRDGRSQLMRLTTGDLSRWLLPGGWDRRPAAFERLVRALRDLDRLRVPIEIAGTSGGLLKVVDCVLLPRAFDRGRGPVVLRVSIPGSSARGAHVDWDRLTRYGAKSAPVYRAYLSVCAVLDYTGRHGRPLSPVVPAPVLGDDGKPKRHKGGRIVRSPVVTVPNPAARFVGWLGHNDVRRMVGLKADHHENRKRAMEAVAEVADGGVCSVQHGRGSNRGLLKLWAPGETWSDD